MSEIATIGLTNNVGQLIAMVRDDDDTRLPDVSRHPSRPGMLQERVKHPSQLIFG
jgi:hypothetical protein